jgi:hypothetical protein
MRAGASESRNGRQQSSEQKRGGESFGHVRFLLVVVKKEYTPK